MDFTKRPKYVPSETPDVPEGDEGVPQIGLIQSLSPERDEDSSKYIEGANDGQLFHSGSRELYPGKVGILVRVIHVHKQWVEWIPRKQGGGLVATYNDEVEANHSMTPGNDLQVSISYYVLIPDDSLAVIRLATPTKMKVHREWRGLIEKSGSMSNVLYTVVAVKEKNRQGQVYYNFGIKADRWLNKVEVKETSTVKKELLESMARVLTPQIASSSDEEI